METLFVWKSHTAFSDWKTYVNDDFSNCVGNTNTAAPSHTWTLPYTSGIEAAHIWWVCRRKLVCILDCSTSPLSGGYRTLAAVLRAAQGAKTEQSSKPCPEVSQSPVSVSWSWYQRGTNKATGLPAARQEKIPWLFPDFSLTKSYFSSQNLIWNWRPP